MSQTWESEVTDVRKVGRADKYKIMGHFGKTNKVILISLSVTFRSSHLEMFYKKNSENFRKTHWKKLKWRPFSPKNKLQLFSREFFETFQNYYSVVNQ